MPFCVTVSITVLKKTRVTCLCDEPHESTPESLADFFLRSVLIISSHLFLGGFELFFSFGFLYQIMLRISVIFHVCYLLRSFHPPCFSYPNYVGKIYFFPTGYGVVTYPRLASILQLQRVVWVVWIYNCLHPPHLGRCVSCITSVIEYLPKHDHTFENFN